MDAPERRGHLRVMTVNLLSPDHADWPRRRPLLREGFARLRPDLSALQETVWGDGYAKRSVRGMRDR